MQEGREDGSGKDLPFSERRLGTRRVAGPNPEGRGAGQGAAQLVPLCRSFLACIVSRQEQQLL